MAGLPQTTGVVGLRAVLYGRPTQRTRLAQTLRSITGSFAAALIALAALSANAGLADDASSTCARESNGVVCLDESRTSADPDQIASAEWAAPILAYLVESSLAEVEIVAEPTEPALPPDAPTLHLLHEVRFAAGIAACRQTSLDRAGRLWTRAPPLA